MVGASDSVAEPNTTLNAIVAEAFCEAADYLEACDNFELGCHDLIKEYMAKHQRIIFSGDGYSQEWVAEAARRGLPNIKTTVEAVDALLTDKAVALFEKFGIYTRVELESRAEVLYETYIKTINIEARTMIDMASKEYIPAIVKYTKTLADTVIAVQQAGVDATVQKDMLVEVSEKLALAKAALEQLTDIRTKSKDMKGMHKERAFFFKNHVVPAMAELRKHIDALERVVDAKAWPVPNYSDLIFEV